MKPKQPFSLPSLPVLGAIAISLALAGCVVGPNADVERARASVLVARQDPHVVTYAPLQLSEAEQTLNRAERIWNDTGDRVEAAHLAYIAEHQAHTAVAKAQEGVAEAEARQLADERERLRLSARAREAELATDRAREATLRAREATILAQEATSRAQQELVALRARETDRGFVVTLPEDVLFEYDRAELRPGATRDLYPLVTFLRDHPERTLLIEGHSDNIGPSSYNLDLSRNRAATVRDFLVRNGISPDRIIAYGYGESYPVASNTTEAGRQLNRRVEVVISHEGRRVVVR
jgi:outer membrane protein OmpA-like peptidoglycan-associated protein